MTGRPSKYNEEMQAKADLYVKSDFMLDEEVPTQEGLSLYLEVALSTVKLWASSGDHPQFSATLQACNAKQAKLLATGALRGDLNPTIAKLMLHNHGYSDKVVQDNTSTDGSMSPSKITRVIVSESK